MPPGVSFSTCCRTRLSASIAFVLGIAGCAGNPVSPSSAATPAPAHATVERPLPASLVGEEPAERDRRAILSMVGEFEVRFVFEETTVLAPGYSRRQSKNTGAFETVIVVEDSPHRVVLQHLLVSEDGQHVTKHWRQDWIYEASTRLEFTESQTWRVRSIAAAVNRGAWTQCVYEVSDAPRYCGTGRWTYENGVPSWNSDRTWRPLPRREYTVRSDYDALDALNRHTITPGGWTHEQDNTKTLRQGETVTGALVREFGFNDYRRVQGFDFKPAYDYWNGTQAYWAQVRAAWAQRFAANGGVSLKSRIDGMALIIPLFTQAEEAASGTPVPADEMARTFDEWVVPPGTLAAPATPPLETRPAY